MNKLMTVVAASVCAVSLSTSAVAEENSKKDGAAEKQVAEVAEAAESEDETALFEAGVDADLFSAYVWRNAVQNDRLVAQPCVWADLTALDPFWLGFSVWQNYDLTRRRNNVYRHSLTETDYNVHIGATVWESEDGERSFGLELGHEWYEQSGVQDECRDAYPSTRELYLKGTFDNPFVNVYGQASWMYRRFGDYGQGFHYELGLNKEVELCDSLVAGADWNVNFGDSNYLSYLYGNVDYVEFGDEDDPVEGSSTPRPGIGGTTVKCYLAWSITDWMSLRGTIAYTGLLNGSLREEIGDEGADYDFAGTGCDYPRDLLWGGISLNFTF